MDLLGPYSRSEIIFLEKKSKKVVRTNNPPWLVNCVIYVKIWNFRLNIGRITPAVNLLTLKLFPKNFVADNSAPLIFPMSLCEKVPFWLFCGIRQSVAFVVFVAFWGTTMLFFKKFKIRAFRKVYGLWGYSLPIKTYVRLKFG